MYIYINILGFYGVFWRFAVDDQGYVPPRGISLVKRNTGPIPVTFNHGFWMLLVCV